MKKLFQQYQPFFIFLLKFFVVYGVFTACYQWYLSSFDSVNFETDSITKMVAQQSVALLHFFGQEAYVIPHLEQSCEKLYLNYHYVARIIEGCNAMSVIILFVAFVIAFKGKIKTTVFFVLFGIVLIHFLNILRIALLAMALYYFPQMEHLLHGVVFPLFIYGVVFLLWVIWVQKFSKYAKAS